jgi:hypothetical protein
MNTFKKTLLTSSMGLALSLGAGQAQALITLPAGEFSIKYDFYSAECNSATSTCYGGDLGGGATYPGPPAPQGGPNDIAPGNGTLNETTFGVGRIASIVSYPTGVPTLWNNGDGGKELAVFLYGVADKSITYDGVSGDFTIGNVGCQGGACDSLIHVDYYEMATADYAGVGVWTTANRTAFDQFTGITDVGTLWAKTTFTTGADGINGIYDMLQTTRGATLPTTGSGAWLADCVSGPACAFLDSNAQTNGADLFGQFTLERTVGSVAANGWDGYNNDPVIGKAVPEPGILSLFGGGLLGMSFFRRFANRRG